MARIRTIKPEFWKHEDLSALPADTHMLAAALLNHADDEGYFNANPRLVQAECCPLRDLSVSVHDSLNKLAEIGYLKLGEVLDGKRYGHVVKFADHQVISRAKDSKIKALGIAWSNPGAIQDCSAPEGKGREQGREGKEKSSDPNGSGEPSVSPAEDLLEIPLSLRKPHHGDYGALLFGPGLDWLADVLGKPPAGCRVLLGKWLKDCGQDHQAVYELLAQCQAEQVAEPVSWVTAALKPRSTTVADALAEARAG